MALAATVAVGVGLTVIVKVTGRPTQPLAVGVTVIVAVTGAPVALVAVKAGVLPVPEAANPIVGSELVQAKVPPAGVVVKTPAGTGSPSQ